MDCNKSPLILRFLSLGLIVFAAFSAVHAAEDGDPNSPVPILLSDAASTRVLATDEYSARYGSLAKIRPRAFHTGQRIVVYATNFSLLEGENASSLRLEMEDGSGKKFRFPVIGIAAVRGQSWIYALTVRLTDELGFWDAPKDDGDVLVGLTWRGLASNRTRLGLGKMGGDIKDDPDSVPTPLANFAAPPTASTINQSNFNKGGDPAPDYVGYKWSGDRMRFMEQATFGPTDALDSQIRRIGLRTWLAGQFDAPYPSATNPYPDLALKSSDSNNTTIGCGMFANPSNEYSDCIRTYYSQFPLQNWFFKEAFYGDAQLRHRVAWALSQLMVTSGVDIQQSSHMIAYHQVLSQNAFGNYRTLMKQMTLNPAMGDYLDMARSTKSNPNENYPREILQLFSVGLFMLNQDGTVQKDANGVPIPSYDQTTVNNFTKVFTGFGFCNTTCTNSAPGVVNFKDPMILTQTNHDVTAKTLFNYTGAVNSTIPANTNGNTEIDMALDNIFYHPNVAPFVSKFLIQQLVTSDPTPAYVGRVSAVFNNNGFGVRGDLKAVVKAILLDPEARGDVKTDPNYGKLREPVQLMTNVMRTFNVRSADGTQPSDGVVAGLANGMLQNPFYSPTVFNYYAPGYVVPGSSLKGPEFGIMTTGSAIARANFANTMVFGKISSNTTTTPQGTSLDFSQMQTIAAADTSSNQLLDALNTKMMHGKMSASMRSTILNSVNTVAATSPLARVQQAVYLIATSSQYQVQR